MARSLLMLAGMECHLKKIGRWGQRLLLASLSFALALPAPAASSQASRLKISHIYNLSDFSGTIPYSSVRIYSDTVHDELYVSSGGNIRVFNATGMEIYRFDEDSQTGAIGAIQDMTTDASGEIYFLSYDFSDPVGGPKYSIAWCNYRGEVRERIQITGIPEAYSGFHPHFMFFRDEKFLLVDRMGMLAVETDRNGVFVKGYDLGDLIGVEPKDRPNTEIFGFCVDGEGSMYFTVPVHFRAYRIASNGEISSFGKAGSAPGGFGVVSGIAVDGSGNLFVSDKRRHKIMVFDRQFRFLQEFGGYGEKREHLAYPDDLCLDRSGKVYISQVKKRGVSVFQVVSN